MLSKHHITLLTSRNAGKVFLPNLIVGLVFASGTLYGLDSIYKDFWLRPPLPLQSICLKVACD